MFWGGHSTVLLTLPSWISPLNGFLEQVDGRGAFSIHCTHQPGLPEWGTPLEGKNNMGGFQKTGELPKVQRLGTN